MEFNKTEVEPLIKASLTWRPLSTTDITSLIHIASTIHPSLPESASVFAERITLFPSGCLALIEERSNQLCGYAISHPIRYRSPPALDHLLGEIAPDADQYYIHDLAILPEFRGAGCARECVKRILAVAEGFSTTCLVSVYGTERFWGRYGFLAPLEVEEVLRQKVVGYGSDAVYLERRDMRD